MKIFGLPVCQYWKHPSFSGFKEEESITKIGILGRGAFSDTYKVHRLLDPTVYALKQAGKECDIEFLIKESAIVKYLNKQEDKSGVNYLVRVLAVFDLKDKMALLEPLYQGDLKSLVKSEKGLSTKRTLEIMAQFFEILSFIKKHGVIHRDIKPDNVLISESGAVKLCDFGFAILKTECPPAKVAGCPNHISPEYYINKTLCDYASDMWSTAVLFCFVYLGDVRMFDGKTVENIFLNHQIRLRKPYSKNLLKHMTSNHKKSFLWEREKTSQPTFEALLQSSFLLKKRKEASLETVGSKSVEEEVSSVLDEIKDRIEFNKFSRFLKELFEFDPDKRATPEKALLEFKKVFGSKL